MSGYADIKAADVQDSDVGWTLQLPIAPVATTETAPEQALDVHAVDAGWTFTASSDANPDNGKGR